MYIWVLTAVGVHALISSVDVHTCLCVRTLVGTRLTLINVLAKPSAQQLVSFWALAGEPPWFVDTLELTEVAGVAALIYVIAGKAIRPQLVSLVTATQEGAVSVVTPLLTGGAHVALIYIYTGAVVPCQLEARLTLTGEGSRNVDTTMLTVPVSALINIYALGANLTVPLRTLAGERPWRVDTLLAGLAVVLVALTLVHIDTVVPLWFVAQRTGVEGLTDRALQGGPWLAGGVWGWDDRGGAGETQVSSIVVETLHLPLAGLRDGVTLIYVFAVLSLRVPLITICAFRVGVTFRRWL